MTTLLPGDEVLWYVPGVGWHGLAREPGAVEYRARPVAADDAVLGVVEAARAVTAIDTGTLHPADAARIEALRAALEVVDGR